MRTLAAAVTAAALSLAVPPAAAAGGAPPEGRPCRYTAVQWDPLGPQVWNGAVAGGPVVAPDGSPVSVTCSIHVNGGHAYDPAAVSVTGPTAPGVGVVAPVVVSFRAGETDYVVLCTSATVGATRWYWDGAGWTTDGTTPCDLHYDGWPVTALPPEAQPAVWYALCLTYGVIRPSFTTCSVPIDDAVCPLLRALHPGLPGKVDVDEEGDVYVTGKPFWDCPPYDIWP